MSCRTAAWYHIGDLVGKIAVDAVEADAALERGSNAAVDAVAVDEPNVLLVGDKNLQSTAPRVLLEVAPAILRAEHA